MTLVFTKQGKPDTRMIEYDQAVVRLGLEKADMEKQVEIIKREIKNLQITRQLEAEAVLENRALMTNETKDIFDKKIKKLSSYELEISERARRSRELEVYSIKIDKRILNSKKLLEEKEVILNNLKEAHIFLEKNIIGLKDAQKSSLEDANKAHTQAHIEEEKKSKLVTEISNLGSEKFKLNNDISYKYKELEELNEIISILRASYKDGLLAVDFAKGENQRLKEKEEFLVRKEKDLAKYEERVEKQRKEAGISTPMIFK